MAKDIFFRSYVCPKLWNIQRILTCKIIGNFLVAKILQKTHQKNKFKSDICILQHPEKGCYSIFKVLLRLGDEGMRE